MTEKHRETDEKTHRKTDIEKKNKEIKKKKKKKKQIQIQINKLED